MNFLKITLASLVLLTISGCVKPETVVTTKVVPVDIPIVNRPAPPSLISPKIYVVTAENYDEFVGRFTQSNGELVFVAISIKDYENLSINLEEIKAYILKQNEVIVYYEDAIKDSKDIIQTQE